MRGQKGARGPSVLDKLKTKSVLTPPVNVAYGTNTERRMTMATYEQDPYYEEKRKDSAAQTVLLMWLMVIAVGVGSCYCTYKWLTHKCPEPGSVQTVQKGE